MHHPSWDGRTWSKKVRGGLMMEGGRTTCVCTTRDTGCSPRAPLQTRYAMRRSWWHMAWAP